MERFCKSLVSGLCVAAVLQMAAIALGVSLDSSWFPCLMAGFFCYIECYAAKSEAE